MGNVALVKRSDLIFLQGHQRHRVSVEAHELDLESSPFAVDQHSGPYISADQALLRQIAGQGNYIHLVERFQSLGRGCAVTNLGAAVPFSINHAQRMFKRVPTGAMIDPSTTNRVPYEDFSMLTSS